MVAVILASPKAGMMANMLRLEVLVDGWRYKGDQGGTKNLQDGSPRVVLENGPNQDCACGTRLMPRLGGFVQFYLGTWLHRWEDDPSQPGSAGVSSF